MARQTPATDQERIILDGCCHLSQPCLLCQFSLWSHELIVAETTEGRHTRFHTDGVDHISDDLGVVYHDARCTEGTETIYLFHSGCFARKRKGIPIPPAMASAVYYDYSPPLSRENRRAVRIQQLLANRLRAAYPALSVPEVVLQIAGYLVHECAATSTLSGFSVPWKPSALAWLAYCPYIALPSAEYVVDLSRNVYAQYSLVEGVGYVQRLFNAEEEGTPPNKYAEATLLYNAQRRTSLLGGHHAAVCRISVAADHLGIRLVKFFGESDDLDSIGDMDVPGAWWSDLEEPRGISSLQVTADSCKLREIRDASEPKARGQLPTTAGWATRKHPHSVMNLTSLGLFQEPLHMSLRMGVFSCNAPGITGYSVATNGYRMLRIHAHHQDEGPHDLRFYGNVSWEFIWVYLPMASGEYLSEIFTYLIYLEHKTFPVLIFTTSRGRSVSFAHSFPHISIHRIWQAPMANTAAVATPAPCRIYYEHARSWERVSYIAFEAHGNRSNVDNDDTDNRTGFVAEEDRQKDVSCPSSLRPTSASPQRFLWDMWMFSSCSMKGAVAVTVCRGPAAAGPQPAITGMLVKYADGGLACLGQFRLDWRRETLRLMPDGVHADSAVLYIGSRDGEVGYDEDGTYVAYVTTAWPSQTELADQDAITWLPVAQTNGLEWWFRPWQSAVCLRQEQEDDHSYMY